MNNEIGGSFSESSIQVAWVLKWWNSWISNGGLSGLVD
jgi:hypothetical protein